MSSEDLLAKAEEVAKKNPFLVLVGAGCLTPNQVPVSATKELGLTNQEEKDAKLIAVFRRDKPEQYQALFLRVLKKLFEKEQKKMETKWGAVHFLEEIRKLAEKTFRESDKKVRVCIDSFHGIHQEGPHDFCISSARGARPDIYIVGEGYRDIIIRVYEEKYLKPAQKFARAYEKKTGKKVEIHREY